MGLVSGIHFSALTLLSDLQPPLLCQLRQALLCAPGAEQRNGLRSEPLLGDRHELLERTFAGLAKELDRARRFTEPNTTRQVVNDAAPTRSRAAMGEGAKVVVVALDCRFSPLPSKPPPNFDSFAGRTLLWRAFAPAEVSLNLEPFYLRVQPTGYIPRGRHSGRGTKEEPRVRSKDGERLRQTSIHLPVELDKRIRKYAFDQEVTLSTVMVEAIEAWLDTREG